MILDGHIHVKSTAAKKAPFLKALHQAGVAGGVVLSAFPSNLERQSEPFQNRLKHVIELCKDEEYLYPFFFINPTEESSLEQVDAAVDQGIAGFKIIATSFYPSDPRNIEVLRRIAKHKKPVLFHSGILWDGLNASGNYNKPTEFEILLSIPGLYFALAHISWPWCDECIAVYGKFDNALSRASELEKGPGEMFIDNTPGTPEVYRREALKKVLFSGYNVRQNFFFGTDNFVDDYNVNWAKSWIDRDLALYREFGLDDESIELIFSQNLQRFVCCGQQTR
jgi:predicted TIM-barrel fold metal-dependent hydrolase